MGEKQSRLVGSKGTKFHWRLVTYVAPAGLIGGVMLVNDLGDATEHTLNMVVDGIMLGLAVDSKESRASVQRDLSELEDWAERDLMELKDKSEILNTGQSNGMQKMRTVMLGCSSAEMDQDILADKKLNRSQQPTFTQAWRAHGPLQQENTQQAKK